MTPKMKTIDEYIKAAPRESHKILKEFREHVHKVAPGADESISYGMPTFKLYGKPLIYFAGWKSHVGIYALPAAVKKFVKELKNYQTSKGTIQIPLDKPYPKRLMQKVIDFRIKDVLEKMKK